MGVFTADTIQKRPSGNSVAAAGIPAVFLDRNGGQTSRSICEMAYALKTIAKYHTEIPQDELDALATICRKLTVTSDEITEKNAIRLSQLDDPFTRYKFLNNQHRIMENEPRLQIT